jgi:hypothetical protein
MGLITKIWNGFRQLLGLILPFFARARDLRGKGPQFRRVLHVVLLLAVLVVLGIINYLFNLGQYLRAPWIVRETWLPLLFLLVYVVSWLGWWLWQLLQPEEESSDFPDIDAAWEAAVSDLNEAGIDLTEAPLFLVLGRAAAPEEALFAAAQLQLTVKQAPRRGDAPLHVYANRDAIYVTCAGASLLGRQAGILSEDAAGAPAYPMAAASGGLDGGESQGDPFKTLQPRGAMKGIQEILARADREGRAPTEQEQEELRGLMAQEKGEHGARASRPPLLRNESEVQRLTARLKHLCQLIVRDRRPFCPANGLLLLVPLAAADSEEDANQTAAICHHDLAAVRDVFQIHAPVFALLCDLEKAPGFSEFLQRFPQDQRQRRLGQRFPLVPDVAPDKLPPAIDSAVGWICQALFPTWVYKMFRMEKSAQDITGVVQGNTRLYQLLSEMRERQKHFSRILTRGLLLDAPGPLLFGGCYVAGTGADPDKEQGFVAGTFRRLTENQDYVSWTDDALVQDADYRSWTTYGYVFLGIFTAVMIGVVYWFWPRD